MEFTYANLTAIAGVLLALPYIVLLAFGLFTALTNKRYTLHRHKCGRCGRADRKWDRHLNHGKNAYILRHRCNYNHIKV